MTQTSSKIGRYRWTICTLLFFATTINYMDRQVISILKPVLESELKWVDSNNIEKEYSYIIMAFQAAYAIGLLLFGWVIDKIGTKKGYAISILIWGLSSISHAFTKTSTGFGFSRVGLGLGESGNFPAAIKTVAEWFPKKERALATGIFNSGANIGAVIAPLLIPWAIYAFASNPSHPAWQAGFILTGLLDLIWLSFWLFIYQKPERKEKLCKTELEYIHSDKIEDNTESVPWIKLFRCNQTWAFLLGKLLTDCIFWFYLFWLPSYLKDKYHVDIKDIANFALPLILIYSMTTIGSVGGGWLSSSFLKKGWSVNKSRKTTMLICALLVVPIVSVKYVSLWPAVLLIGLAAAAHQAWSANIMTTVSDMFPKKAVASVTGIGGMAGSVGGIAFASVTGVLLEHYKTIGTIETGYSILFVIAGFTYLSALLIFHLLVPKINYLNI